jgi:two-component system NtrC family sensor kinase
MKPAILIVDDSLTVRMDLRAAFEAAGFETAGCATILAARGALARTDFSLIVLDVMLPDGDGIDLLTILKRDPRFSAIPVLLLSSEAEVKDRVRGLKTGADDYLGKPYDVDHVIARSRELIRKRDIRNPSHGSISVLLVDDSVTYREAIKTALQAAGYTVSTAASGEEGLRVADSLRPDAIVVDGVMSGIDGATMVRRLRSDLALNRTPCLLLTATNDRQSEVAALDSGADAFMRKDTDVGLVLTRLSSLLRTAATRNEKRAVPVSLFGPKKILAVDHTPTYLDLLVDTIRQEGCDVIPARSGHDALELLSVQPVDCILLELNMPELSGEETCRQIKNSPAWRDIPLIMLSSHDESAAMIAAINAGADDFILKSDDFELLKARLRAQLRRKQFEDDNRSIREHILKREFDAAELRAAAELAETRALLLRDLEIKNKELESFSYSVSHDLRAPLRAIDGFSRIVLEQHSAGLDEQGKGYLQRVCAGARRMSEMIDALLELARITRHEIKNTRCELTSMCTAISAELAEIEPERNVKFTIAEGLEADGDPQLLRLVLQNLVGNAWKYSRKRTDAKIEFGLTTSKGKRAFFLRDNGAGFEMEYAGKLFGPFQRLHSTRDFEGTGIGLATVYQIIHRHGGEIWAEGKPDEGATFYFTLAPVQRS